MFCRSRKGGFKTMRLQQALTVVVARRMLALLVLGVTVGAALAASLTWPATYVARTSLILDARGVDPVTGQAQPVPISVEYLATQDDVITSHRVAVKVVDKLGLTADKAMREDYFKNEKSPDGLRDWIADRLIKNLKVTPSRDSNVISVSYAARDAVSAARLANAFADAYLQTNLELKVEPIKRQAAWFQDQVQVLRRTLESAQQRLAAYQNKNKLLGSDTRLDVENSRFTELSRELVSAQAAQADTQSRLKQIVSVRGDDKLEQIPDVLSSSLMQNMKADLARAQGKLAETAKRFGPRHPQYLASLAEVNELNAKLSAEMQTALGSVRQGAQIAAQRVAELQRAVDQQKLRILELQEQNDEFSVLSQDVQAAQRAYDSGTVRAGELRMQGQSDQTSVAVLSVAAVPSSPDSPRLILNLLLSLMLGTVLAVAATLAAELLDRRVRSDRDLLELVGLPLIAHLPRA